MRHRALRFAIVGVLLAAGAAASLFVRQQIARARDEDGRHEDVIARLDRISSMLRGVADEELRSVALSVSDRTAETIPDIIAAVESEVSALRPRTRSERADAHMSTVVDAAHLLAAIDGRARDNVRVGRPLMATDLVLSEGRRASASIESALSALRTAEVRSAGSARASLYAGIWGMLGVVAVAWAIGLMLLAPPARAQPDLAAPQEAPAVTTPPPGVPPAPTAPEPLQTLDIERVADACGAIARAGTTSGLTEALAGAANVLHVPGLIVWMGSDGELFAALSVGYDQRIMSRLGAIPRDADNATAAAWRTAETQTVPGDIASRGAIVVPMRGPDGCLGVLAAEVPHGTEQEPVTRAAVTLIAAQLVSVMAAWPSASRLGSESAAPPETATDSNKRLQA